MHIREEADRQSLATENPKGVTIQCGDLWPVWQRETNTGSVCSGFTKATNVHGTYLVMI